MQRAMRLALLLLLAAAVQPSRALRHVRDGRTARKLPYVLDRCVDVKKLSGSADYMGKEPMSLNVCYEFCSRRNSFYFGVQKGKECWCAGSYQAVIGGFEICDVPCPGNEDEMCGGKDSTSVFIMASGPCDKGQEKALGNSEDKNLGEAHDALKDVEKIAEKMVDKKNAKVEIKAEKALDKAQRLVAEAKEEIKQGDEGAAKAKIASAKKKTKKAIQRFKKMTSVGKKRGSREKQAVQDLKAAEKQLDKLAESPTPETAKQSGDLLKQAAAKPPPKRPNVCGNWPREFKSLEFMGLHGQFLRHQGFRLKVSPKETSDLFKSDATFEVLPPLLSSADCGVSFRSKNFPKRYIRHKGFKLFLHPDDGTDLFKGDATFFMVKPNDGTLGGSYLLRSANFPDRYLHSTADGSIELHQLPQGKEKEFSFKLEAPLMTTLGSRVIKEVSGGDWTDVKCDPGYQIIGGGCDAKDSPHKMQFNGPRGEFKWKCGGHGGPKKVWAICAKGVSRRIKKVAGGDWVKVDCAPGQKVISGGCNSYSKPHKHQYNGPDGESSWKCGGHGGKKRVWALCSAEVPRTIKEVSGGDWVTVECDKGKKVISGGCNAKDSPHIYQYNGPEGEYAWKCGGHGGPKQVWAICEA